MTSQTFLLNIRILTYVNSYSALKILSIDVSYVGLSALYIFPKILGVPGTKGAKSRVAQGVGVEYFLVVLHTPQKLSAKFQLASNFVTQTPLFKLIRPDYLTYNVEFQILKFFGVFFGQPCTKFLTEQIYQTLYTSYMYQVGHL